MKPQPHLDYPISVVDWERNVETRTRSHYRGMFEVHLNYQVCVLVADLTFRDAELALRLPLGDPDEANHRAEAFRAAISASDAAVVLGDGPVPVLRVVEGQPWLAVPIETMRRLLTELDHAAGGFRDGAPRSVFTGGVSAALVHGLLMSESFPEQKRAWVTSERGG